jgi:hypothetical protein
MKRVTVIFAAVAMMSICSDSFAQGLSAGLKTGVNLSNIDFDGSNTNSRVGFIGGAYAVWAFSEKWAIQPEVFFSGKGADYADFDDVIKLNYLTIPVLIRWRPIELLSFHAGPQFSFLLSAENKAGDSLKDSVTSGDIGLALGTTVHLPKGFNGGLRYVRGTADIIDNQSSGSTGAYNSTFQIFVGYDLFGAK